VEDSFDEGFIVLWRKIEKWDWIDDPLTVYVFVRMILHANWMPKKWHGIQIDRGSFIASRATLCKQWRLTLQQLRTIEQRLENTGELTRRSTHRYTMYTIVNYSKYQDHKPRNNTQTTDDQHSPNTVPTTTKQGNNGTIKQPNSNSRIWLDKDYKLRDITEQQLSEWKEVYKNVDVPSELLKIQQYAKANPKWANKKENWNRVIVNWFSS